MTLLEALIAVAIVSGVMATALETFGLTVDRLAIHDVGVEATDVGEALLARAGEDLPFQAKRTVSIGGGPVTWTLESRQERDAGKLRLIEVESHVRLSRKGVVIERTLSTLKLVRMPKK